MLPEEMTAACMMGVQLPPLVAGGASPKLIPDEAEANGPGVLLTKGERQLFLWVVEVPMTDEQFAEEAAEMRKAEMSGVIVVAQNAEQLRETGERRWLYNPRLPALQPPEPAAQPPEPVTSLQSEKLEPKTTAPETPAPQAAVSEVLENVEENTDVAPAPKTRPVISMSAATWKRAEDSRTLLASGEGLREVATRVMGGDAAATWMERRLMTLGGEAPVSASLRPEGLAACLKLLARFPLAVPPSDAPASV